MGFALVSIRSYIREQIQESGTVLADYDGPFGKYLQPCDRDGNLVVSGAEPVALLFAAKHHGAGSWKVVDGNGERVSVIFLRDPEDGNKASSMAHAEAERLNSGGAVVLDSEPAENAGEGDLPDA